MSNGETKARVAPESVPREAITNDPRSAPHCLSALPRTLVPSSSNGVASVRDIPCRNALAADPPGGNNVLQPQELVAAHVEERSCVGIQPTLDSTKVRAMAVTGAPSNFPTIVVFPSSCARDAVNDRAAMFPQWFDGEIMLEDSAGGIAEMAVLEDDLEENVADLLGCWCHDNFDVVVGENGNDTS